MQKGKHRMRALIILAVMTSLVVLGLAPGCDNNSVTCGPGTLLKGDKCVAMQPDAGAGGSGGSGGATGGSGGGSGGTTNDVTIASFTADKLWGDAPLHAVLTWQVTAPAGTPVDCELDADGDGAFETPLLSCAGAGAHPVSLSTVGRVQPRLRANAGGKSVEATEILYVNQIQWAPNVVRVAELTGLVSSVATDAGVTLVFQDAASIPALGPGTVLFDRSVTGYVRKLVSATTTGTTVEITTVGASLKDVATGGFYGMRSDDTGTSTMSLADCDPSTWPGKWNGTFVGIPTIELQKAPYSLTFDNGRIGAGLWIKEAVFDFNPLDLQIHVDIRSKAALCADISAAIEGTMEVSKDIPVPTLGQNVDLGFIHAKAGLVPKLGASIEFSLNVSANVVFSTETAAHFDFAWGQPLEVGASISPNLKFDNFAWSAEGEGKIYFDPAVELTWGNPPKDCKPNTNAAGSLRIGLDPEVGLKANLSATPGKPQICMTAVFYGEASAQAVPPFGVFDCAKVSAPIFPDQPLFDAPVCAPWSGDAGTGGGGAGGAGGAGGTGGATSSSSSSSTSSTSSSSSSSSSTSSSSSSSSSSSGGVCGTLGFAPPVSYASGGASTSVGLGDLNGDGKPDLAIGGYGSGLMRLLFNAGDGTFGSFVDKAASTSVSSVTVADLNGDNKADIVAASQSAQMYVHLATGNGFFAPAVSYAPSQANAVAAADLNGDAKPDLVVANGVTIGSDKVSVLLNNGDGTFAAKVDYGTGTQPVSVALGDLNGDGKADIAVANATSNTVSTLFNQGDGTFTPKIDNHTGTSPRSVAVGDLDGDGKTDIVVANGNSNTVSVFLNQGNGFFAAKVDYAAGSSPRSVALGDFNGDGRPDLAVANSAANAGVSVLLNQGNGTFAAKVDYAALESNSVAVGDLNGDAKPDIVVTNGNTSTASVLLNTCGP